MLWQSVSSSNAHTQTLARTIKSQNKQSCIVAVLDSRLAAASKLKMPAGQLNEYV